MGERAKDQIAAMTDDQIVAFLRTVARYERDHIVITFDHGTDIINVIALYGDRLADALDAAPFKEPK